MKIAVSDCFPGSALCFKVDSRPKGCSTGQHTAETLKPEARKPTPQANLSVTRNKTGQETYTTSTPPTTIPLATPTPATPPPPEEEEEEDLSVEVPVGTTCRHKGCGKNFVSNEVSRLGEGEDTICVYHPKPVRCPSLY